MRPIDTLIVGGGQAGLAMSRCLRERGIEHVILERGRIGERWRTERWDSLRLLTPRWQSRLPGYRYQGPDPDGFMSKLELVEYLERYADTFDAPVYGDTAVKAVRPLPRGYRIDTNQGTWRANQVVLATGECDRPWVPAFAGDTERHIHQVTARHYKNPTQLPEGGVLVVGASATGLQLALEIQASGRPVTLAVGRHTRLPRTYRGMDILWWFDQMGMLDQRPDQVRDLEASRTQPSMQLVGSDHRGTVDLSVAMDRGIRLVGRLEGFRGARAHFSDNLVEDMAAADLKLARLRLKIDRFANQRDFTSVLTDPPPFGMIEPPDTPGAIDLRGAGIRTILWATGFQPDYSWLHVPVLNSRGEMIHNGGVTPSPGLYVMGLRFMRRRNSSFIDGQAKDAAELAEHLDASRLQPLPALA